MRSMLSRTNTVKAQKHVSRLKWLVASTSRSATFFGAYSLLLHSTKE